MVEPGHVEHLKDIGRRCGLNDPAEADRAWLQEHRRTFRLVPNDWEDVCAGLNLEEHVSLFNAVALGARYAGWERGSTSAVIWVFLKLEPRLDFARAFELASWVATTVGGYYLPFGRARLGAAFECLDPESVPAGVGLVEVLQTRVSATRAVRSREVAARDVVRADALRARRVLEAEERAKHLQLKRAKDEARVALIADAEASGSLRCLEAVVARPDLPLSYFPESWARVEITDPSNMPPHLSRQLVARLEAAPKGAWRELHCRLRLELPLPDDDAQLV